MAALIRSAAAALAIATLPASAFGDAPDASRPAFSAPPAVARWRSFITAASRRFGVPEAWIAAVMRAESGGLTTLDGRPITSRAGAMGLMQVMPDTWDAMRSLHHLGDDPYDPQDNIMAGAAYLRLMHDRFGYPGMFAAYNAGPTRYQASLDGGQSLPLETRTYIAELAHSPASTAMPPAILSGTRLFFTLGDTKTVSGDVDPAPAAASNPSQSTPPDTVPHTLFVPLTSSIAAPLHPLKARAKGAELSVLEGKEALRPLSPATAISRAVARLRLRPLHPGGFPLPPSLPLLAARQGFSAAHGAEPAKEHSQCPPSPSRPPLRPIPMPARSESLATVLRTGIASTS